MELPWNSPEYGEERVRGRYVSIATTIFQCTPDRTMREYVSRKLKMLKFRQETDKIEADPLLQSIESNLNPTLTHKYSNFNNVKNDMKVLFHVTAMHPSELVDSVIKTMQALNELTRQRIPHYRGLISKFIYANPSMVLSTKFHFSHDNRPDHYKIQNGTKVYYYLINSDNSKYNDFRQVGIHSVDSNNEEETYFNQSQRLMAKAFKTTVIPDVCIECAFNSTNVADKEMHIIRNNGDMVTEVYEQVDTLWR